MAIQDTDLPVIRAAKNRLRRSQKARFASAGEGLLAEENRRMVTFLLENPVFIRAATVLGYLRYFPEEPDVHVLLDTAVRQNKPVYVPSIPASGSPMRWVRWMPEIPMRRGVYGIPEPETEEVTELDGMPRPVLCLVPGLAFSPRGDRLGRGGGYYDRFLGRFQGNAVGMAFSLSLVDQVPVTDRDVPVSMLATPDGVISICS